MVPAHLPSTPRSDCSTTNTVETTRFNSSSGNSSPEIKGVSNQLQRLTLSTSTSNIEKQMSALLDLQIGLAERKKIDFNVFPPGLNIPIDLAMITVRPSQTNPGEFAVFIPGNKGFIYESDLAAVEELIIKSAPQVVNKNNEALKALQTSLKNKGIDIGIVYATVELVEPTKEIRVWAGSPTGKLALFQGRDVCYLDRMTELENLILKLSPQTQMNILPKSGTNNAQPSAQGVTNKESNINPLALPNSQALKTYLKNVKRVSFDPEVKINVIDPEGKGKPVTRALSMGQRYDDEWMKKYAKGLPEREKSAQQSHFDLLREAEDILAKDEPSSPDLQAAPSMVAKFPPEFRNKILNFYGIKESKWPRNYPPLSSVDSVRSTSEKRKQMERKAEQLVEEIQEYAKSYNIELPDVSNTARHSEKLRQLSSLIDANFFHLSYEGEHGYGFSYHDDDIVYVYGQAPSDRNQTKLIDGIEVRVINGKSVILQAATRGCTAAVAAMLIDDQGGEIDVDALRYTNLGNEETRIRSFKKAGFGAVTTRNKNLVELKESIRIHGPAIATVDSGIGAHVVIIDAVDLDKNVVTLRDPAHGWMVDIHASAFRAEKNYLHIGNKISAAALSY